MKTEPNENVAPKEYVEGYGQKYILSPNGDREWIATEGGLTKREYFAAKAMQGYVSADHIANRGMPAEEIAEWCVNMADALIYELNKD